MKRSNINPAKKVWYKELELTKAEIAALNTTPQEIVGAPGANKTILIENIMAILNSDGVAFTGTSTDLDIDFASGKKAADMTGFLGTTTGVKRGAANHRASGGDDLAVNEALFVTQDSNDLGAGGANATLVVKLWYRIVPA